MMKLVSVAGMSSFLFALTFSGCGPGEYERHIRCQYPNPDYNPADPNSEEHDIRDFCVVADPLCWNGSDPTDLELCSWNWFHDDDHMAEMEVLTWDQTQSCSGSGGYPTGNFPSWWGDNDPKSDGCVGDAPGNGSGGSNQTSATSGAEPTTGAPTTTDGESSTTGEENDGPGDYYCSLRSQYKCANINPDDALGNDPYNRDLMSYPNDANFDACWTSTVNVGQTTQLSKCVTADSKVDAQLKCEQGCNAHKEMQATQCLNAGCTIITPLDCVFEGEWSDESGQTFDDDPLEGPHKIGTVENWQCDGQPLVIGEGPFAGFQGSGTLITPDGNSAGMTGIHGFLSYSLTNCTTTTCTITIDTLVGLTGHAEGGYTDAAGSGGTYELQRMGFQARAPFSGTWHKARKNVTFSTDVLQAQIWTGPVIIDGVSITDDAGVLNAEIDQLVGILQSETGPLTLNLVYEMPLLGTASASMQTVP